MNIYGYSLYIPYIFHIYIYVPALSSRGPPPPRVGEGGPPGDFGRSGGWEGFPQGF